MHVRDAICWRPVATLPASQHTVEASNLWKRFGDRVAVRDVSLTVSLGEIVGFVGPNGAGKTTTIRMLLDVMQPDEGTVSIFGAPLTAATQAAHRLSAGGARTLPRPEGHP